MNFSKNIKYWVAFSHIEGLGPQKIKAIFQYFFDMEKAWKAPINELLKIGLNNIDINNITKARNELNPEKLFNNIKNKNIKNYNTRR